ncbi:MAG: hypothetical protein ABSH13_16810 [Candidatus Acidiferrum sp.]|jgi:hypothetical protein
MSHIASQDETARGFEYQATAPGAAALVRLVPNKTGGQKKDSEEQFLEIRVDSLSGSIGYDIFLELRNWADSVEAPLWQQWLLFELRPLYQIGLAFALVLLVIMLFKTSPTPAEYKDTIKQQARALLRTGIDQHNQSEALRLLLALESDYIPPDTQPTRARKPIAWCLGAVYVLGFLSFTPHLCIAIWEGKKRLRWWNLWIKFNTITIPGIVLAHWIFPHLFSAFDATLGAIR